MSTGGKAASGGNPADAAGGSAERGGAPASGAGTSNAGNGGAGVGGGSGSTATSGAPSNGGAGLGGGGASGAGAAGGTANGAGMGAGGAAAGGDANASGGTPAAGAPNGGAGAGGSAGANRGGTSSGGAAASLRDKYASYFPVGAAVDSQSYMTHAPLLQTHFNSVTPENDMKFDALEPNEGQFTYTAADKIVDFATTNHMKIRGHTLVWHRQNPSWVFSNGSGGTVSKDVLLQRMKNHITQVMQHYHGKVYAWDVVNEAMMEDGGYRTGDETADDQKSPWYAVIGPEYIADAFRYAHDADPDAKLFYNDYYDYIPAKQQGIHDMLKGLLDQGVPIHGVGMQCHLNIEPSTDTTNQSYYQTAPHLEDAIKLYSSLGLEVQVTELDMSLYISGKTYTSDQFYTEATFTDALQTEQADRYRSFFELFRKYQGTLTGVTFWGIADDNTWLSEFSSGRKDFPLLFDTNHKPKKAYYAVVDF